MLDYPNFYSFIAMTLLNLVHFKKAVPIILAIFCHGIAFGQSPDIQTDRPDQTECPFIVPKNFIQIESGVLYEDINSFEQNMLIPTSLIKYGLTDNFELRVIVDFLSSRINNVSSFGMSPIVIGMKTKLCHEHGIIPETSFIGQFTINRWASASFQTLVPAPSFRFTMQHTLSKHLMIGYNLGAEWDGAQPKPTYIYTLTAGINIYKGINGFVEIYGFIPTGTISDHRFDGGFTFSLSDNIQLDISTGFRLTSLAPKYFMSGGVSYRFKCSKK